MVTLAASRLATGVVEATTKGAVPVTMSDTNCVPVKVKAPTSQLAVSGIVPSASKSPPPAPLESSCVCIFDVTPST